MNIHFNLSQRLVCLLAATLLLTFSHCAEAQRGRQSPDDQVVSQAKLVASGELVELYQDNVKVDPAFLAVLENTCRQIEKLLAQPLDKATLGDKIRVYVTNTMVVSHVWHGYQHQSDPRGVLILNTRAYFAGTRGENATYAHELTHLFTWRFRSHTLREGLADYIALQILPGAAVGPNFAGYDWSGKIPSEVIDLLGTTIAPPAWASDDIRLRQAYYFGSYRFVKLLIEKGGLPKFMKLYTSNDPETAFVELYGESRTALLQSLDL